MATKFLFCGRSCVPDAKKKKWNPVERVFDNELLFNKILKFALHDGDGTDIKTASSCKLVNSTWLENINVVLKRKDEPPVKLDTSRNTNKIIKYVYAFERCPADDILPYQLTIAPINFENYRHWETVYTATILQSGIKCLLRCGHGLVELTINCQNVKWNMISDYLLSSSAPLDLPNLQKVKIELGRSRPLNRRTKYLVETAVAQDENFDKMCVREGTAVKEKKSIRKMEAMAPNGRMHDLVKKIFAASDHVKYFSLINYPNNTYSDVVIWGIDPNDLILPKSLQEINLMCCSGLEYGLPTSQLAFRLDSFFTHSDLSNLTSLTLEMSLCYISSKLKVIRILNTVNRHLQKLDISNAEMHDANQIYIQLPVMPALKELLCGLWICEGGFGGRPILQKHFPVLQKFVCFETSAATLLKWVEIGDNAVSVEDVQVEFFDPLWSETNPRESFLISDKMCRIKLAFPNLARLSLVFPDFEHQVCGMTYIFQQLPQLHILQVHQNENDVSSDKWNALLLGISVEEAGTLQKTLCRGNIKFRMESSIVNLRELKKLNLSTSVDEDQAICYLGITVKYGISRMSNLVDFSFSGGFSLKINYK